VMKVVRYCNTTKENTQQVASLLSSAGVIWSLVCTKIDTWRSWDKTS
jgi:hypothetical protein